MYMSKYEQVCSTYQCDSCYKTFSTKGSCPKCGISEDEIDSYGTNDRKTTLVHYVMNIGI